MQINKGWLSTATQCPSPHFNQRPTNCAIDMVVIHNISLPPGQFAGGYIQDFFQGRLDTTIDPYFATIANLRVSSHLLIGRQGEITQFVAFVDRAWHAGVSTWQGRDNCNDYSIGIELEGADDIPFTEHQYQQLNQVLKLLMQHYPTITRDRIVGHSDIAPGRKTDPGSAFAWDRLSIA